MRTFRFSSLLLPLIVLLAAGAAAAQSSASHEVRVRIPEVLRLRLDGDRSADRADVPLRIEVEDGAYRIDPAGTDLEIYANSAWQLTASWAPAGAADADARLRWRVDGGAWSDATPYPSELLAGERTGAWRAVRVDYGLREIPADGVYRGAVTYTLARP